MLLGIELEEAAMNEADSRLKEPVAPIQCGEVPAEIRARAHPPARGLGKAFQRTAV